MRWNVLDLSLRTAMRKLRSRRIFLLDVDAASVSQIVYTLLDNAAKYSDPRLEDTLVSKCYVPVESPYRRRRSGTRYSEGRS